MVRFGGDLSPTLTGPGKLIEQLVGKHRYGIVKPDVNILQAPVGNCNNCNKCKALTVPAEVPEGVNFLHISLWVQLMNRGCNLVIRLLFQFHLFRVSGTKPRSSTASSSTLSPGWLLGSSWSTMRAALSLGSLWYNGRPHPGQWVITCPGWVGFKRWMAQIWLGKGFLDTRVGPVNPNLYFALSMAFL